MKNINRIKKLIKNQCAGYFDKQSAIHNYCSSKDGSCVFFGDNEELPACRYFEEGVLPLDTGLEFEYRQEHKMGISQNRQAKPKVKCERCETSFDANSNRQKCCEKCRKIIKREKDRNRQQKVRAKRV